MSHSELLVDVWSLLLILAFKRVVYGDGGYAYLRFVWGYGIIRVVWSYPHIAEVLHVLRVRLQYSPCLLLAAAVP